MEAYRHLALFVNLVSEVFMDSLPDSCPLFPRISRMLLRVTGLVLAPRIEAAKDVEERMLK